MLSLVMPGIKMHPRDTCSQTVRWYLDRGSYAQPSVSTWTYLKSCKARYHLQIGFGADRHGWTRPLLHLHLVQVADELVEGEDPLWVSVSHGKALWDGDSSLAWETGDLFP